MTLLDPATWQDRIAGRGWITPGGGSRPVIEPATGHELGRIGIASIEEVRRAAAEAAEAQVAWAATPPEQRAAVLRRAGDLWGQHAEEINTWLIREAGSIGPKAALETHMAAGICYEASALPTHPSGEVLPSNNDHWSLARRRPAGVVSVIAPFNFPLILSIRSVAPALALGNAVLLKPDPRTAVCGGVSLYQIFAEAGLPDGLLHLLPGDAEVGAAVVEAPEVSVVSFTGSTPAGRKVGEAASRLLKRAHLELGGNNALVVLPSASREGLAKAVSAGAFGSFLHQGQICMTTGRHLVHESVVEEYARLLAEKAAHLPVGDPATEHVAQGPIIDERQLANIDRIVSESAAGGATVLAGGAPQGRFYPPTVLTGLTADSPAWREEIFGPVAPIMAWSDLDEVADLVNDSEYALSVGILGEVGEAMRLADKLHSGKIHINEQTVADEPNVPFGGMKDSGNGARFGGTTANLEAFTEVQWVTIRPDIAPYPF